MDNGEPKFARLILPDGQEVRLPVITPSVGPPAVDVRALYGSSGYFTYDPGFRSTASCSSAITYIDGGAGQLLYRGYRIEELASKSDFDEVSYLLMYGELPTKKQKVTHRNTLLHHTMVHEKLIKFFDGFKSDAHPMAIMVGVVGALSAFYHDSLDIHDAEQRRLSAYRLVAKMPTIAAIAYKTSIGQPIMYPRNDLSFAENFLYMMFAVPCEPYYIPECKARALEAFLILHMDHEQNASTSTVRIAGSSQANPYACIASGITALWGPAHGGANEAVVRMLREIGTKERIPLFLERAKDKSDPFRLMGFGHRVYKAMDPRARQMRKCVDELHESLGVDNDPMLQLALDLEAAALADDYFVKRKLFPNVDFYSGAVLLALNIPTNMFTSLFAVSRTIGWITNWMEHFANNSQISRPRQVYTGYGERPFVPLEARIADDDDDEEPAKPELPGRRVSAFHA